MKKIILFLFIACSSCSGIRKAKKLDIVKKNTPFQIKDDGNDSLRITYTGCGGFLIQKDSSAIFIDPYFSNVNPLPLILFKKLKTDTVLVDGFFKKHFDHQKDTAGIIKAILVAHSHYDHLADVPAVYSRNCNQDSTDIIGSPTTKHILSSINLGEDVTVVHTSKENKNENPNWIYVKNNRIRILPVPTKHAPHICGMKLISSKKLKKDRSKYPKKVNKFPEGENFNFFIDFLNNKGEVECRIFSHAGAACEKVKGIPHESILADILAEKNIDVLLLCAASFNQVKGYPEEVIARLQPKFIIGNHWENFFRPYDKNIEGPGTVPGTNVKKFVSRVNKQIGFLELTDSTEFRLPLPGVTFSFEY